MIWNLLKIWAAIDGFLLVLIGTAYWCECRRERRLGERPWE